MRPSMTLLALCSGALLLAACRREWCGEYDKDASEPYVDCEFEHVLEYDDESYFTIVRHGRYDDGGVLLERTFDNGSGPVVEVTNVLDEDHELVSQTVMDGTASTLTRNDRGGLLNQTTVHPDGTVQTIDFVRGERACEVASWTRRLDGQFMVEQVNEYVDGLLVAFTQTRSDGSLAEAEWFYDKRGHRTGVRGTVDGVLWSELTEERDAQGRLLSAIRSTGPDSTPVEWHDYDYDEDGNETRHAVRLDGEDAVPNWIRTTDWVGGRWTHVTLATDYGPDEVHDRTYVCPE